MRIGQGVDVHAFSDDPARRLVLGGVEIPDGPGLAGHSDADVVLHAVVDALLSACGLGDIGAMAGVDDPATAGAPSRVFVEEAMAGVRTAGWEVGNAAITIIAARPRIAPHRPAIAASVARLLGVADGRVSITATTTDGLGFTGRGEGIAGLAVVLLVAGGADDRR